MRLWLHHFIDHFVGLETGVCLVMTSVMDLRDRLNHSSIGVRGVSSSREASMECTSGHSVLAQLCLGENSGGLLTEILVMQIAWLEPVNHSVIFHEGSNCDSNVLAKARSITASCLSSSDAYLV